MFHLFHVIASELKHSSYLWHLAPLNTKMFMTRCNI